MWRFRSQQLRSPVCPYFHPCMAVSITSRQNSWRWVKCLLTVLDPWAPWFQSSAISSIHHSSAINSDIVTDNRTSFKVLIYTLWLFYHLLLPFQLNIPFQHCFSLTENPCPLTFYLELFSLSPVPDNSGSVFPWLNWDSMIRYCNTYPTNAITAYIHHNICLGEHQL